MLFFKILNKTFIFPRFSSSRSSHSSNTAAGISSQNEPQKGVVTILDTVRVYRQDRDEVKGFTN